MSGRFVCVHGHFYQPPRENPWLDAVERQPSAAPYHDWNERVTAECYAPNTAARVLDGRDRIVDIVNNFATISFDAGPTLLAWLERADVATYTAILEADRAGRARFRGHGPAMAQAYNHVIMPLANARDKRTQVRWGAADFERRFGRKAEGMWLPETAVDLETLEFMAAEGIRFTVLAPRQAEAVRPLAGGEWRDVRDGTVDPRRPYLCRLPSGRSIALFFYDGPIAHDLAFGDVLKNGVGFAERLVAAFSPESSRPELVHVATDGETYGHHHRFGEMALAYALRHVERQGLAEVTIYGDFLERFPPEDEVLVAAMSSWSCVHGVERWRAGCSCATGEHPGWRQDWRAPLREAMDWLGERAAETYERGLGKYEKDPWAVRDDSIRIFLDSSPESIGAFLADHIGRRLAARDRDRILALLELGRQSMLIFTSCGWFFDDISNIETVQNLRYAARALELIRDTGGPDFEAEFVERLEAAESNDPRVKNGAVVYETMVKPARPDPLRPCAGLVSEGEKDAEAPGVIFGRGVASLVEAWAGKPDDTAALEKLEAVLSVHKSQGHSLDLWRSQNAFFKAGRALRGTNSANASWDRAFHAVAELLGFDPEVFTATS
ncbi:MAG: DUF3536 domain-containing protein [Candidatus Aminicenantes bacterium]|nr:DUF3536 domain-containing protein [Candidatus Aminicenantes bacterium]NLH77657.1 DUF3536 domain-containing protein [Acidobacteriota bacterium]